MNVIIIEDELQSARDLKHAIETLRPYFIVQSMLDSVESSLEWFSHHEPPDLIFSDIQLGDGLAFDIFAKITITCPVIFCTAYDEYAINAFQHNGVDYLLKPVSEKQLIKGLGKIDLLKKSAERSYDAALLYKLLREWETNAKNYKSNFLVPYREKLIPVHIEDISSFSVHDNSVQLHTKDSKTYPLPNTLDHIESIINPQLFYRVNRQWLVAYSAIKEAEHYFDRKLLIKLHQPGLEPLVVSKAKASEFLKWMERR